jgi:nucleoside phosphorylase
VAGKVNSKTISIIIESFSSNTIIMLGHAIVAWPSWIAGDVLFSL